MSTAATVTCLSWRIHADRGERKRYLSDSAAIAATWRVRSGRVRGAGSAKTRTNKSRSVKNESSTNVRHEKIDRLSQDSWTSRGIPRKCSSFESGGTGPTLFASTAPEPEPAADKKNISKGSSNAVISELSQRECDRLPQTSRTSPFEHASDTVVVLNALAATSRSHVVVSEHGTSSRLVALREPSRTQQPSNKN